MREELDEGLGEEEFFIGSEECEKATICSRLDLSDYSRALSRCSLPQPLDVKYGFARNLECDISPIKVVQEPPSSYKNSKSISKKRSLRNLEKHTQLNSPNFNSRLAAEVKRYEKCVDNLTRQQDFSHEVPNDSHFVMHESMISNNSSSPSVIEMSRHKLSSPLCSREVDKRLADHMLDLTLTAIDEVNKSALLVDEAVQTEFYGKKNKKVIMEDKQTSYCFYQPRLSEPCLSAKHIIPFRLSEEFKKQFRGPLIDIDSIEHKGGVSKAYDLNLRGRNVANLISGPRCRSNSRTRRSASSSTIILRRNHIERPPFCSTVTKSVTGLTHAVHANEQLVLALVHSRFTHWKTLLHNILEDPCTGDNVAVRFLEELEIRQQIRRNIQIDDEQNTYDLQRDDGKVVRMLRKKLSKSNPSRIQQLRILHSVLQNSA